MSEINPHSVQYVGEDDSYDEDVFMEVFSPQSDDWYVEFPTLTETLSRLNMYAARKANMDSVIVTACIESDIQDY